MLHYIFLIALAVVSTPVVGFSFNLLTDHEAIRPTSAPGGLLYCLAKGHRAYQVDGVKTEGDLVVRLTVRPVPIEEVDRRSVVLIGGLIPVSGDGAPTEGRRLYVRSVGWVDHLVCIKGVPV